MCTVSVVPHDTGFRLMCNRDERVDRVPALAPFPVRVEGRRAVLPIDPLGGGTWIGANDAGLVAVLLNRHAPSATVRSSTRRRVSRGAIIPPLLGAASMGQALEKLRRVDPLLFEPFRLVLVQRRAIVMVTSDGLCAHVHEHLRHPVAFASSSQGDAFVEPLRRSVFERLLTRHDALTAQALFHRHCWPARPDVSVLMTRTDACTVSRTIVDATRRSVAMSYEDLMAPSCGAVAA